MLENFLKKYLAYKQIEHPASYFGYDNWRKIYLFFTSKTKWYDRRIASYKNYAEVLDVPYTFLINLARYEEISDERVGGRATSIFGDLL